MVNALVRGHWFSVRLSGLSSLSFSILILLSLQFDPVSEFDELPTGLSLATTPLREPWGSEESPVSAVPVERPC